MSKLKLNLGCASNIMEGYVNIDQDDIEEIRKRYPNKEFSKDAKIFTYNIFKLPYKDGTVDEVIADGFLEHLSFIEEKQFFLEMKRVLKKDGILSFAVPNFELVVKLWLNAKDEWNDFFRLDDEAIEQEHWFGTYTYNSNNRWGYLTAMLYGSQNGEGQFHQNCYTIPKIKSILKKLDFNDIEFEEFLWKGNRDPMIRTKAKK